MAIKAIHTVVAVVGIAVLSGGAWWYQNKSGKPAATEVAGSTASPAAPGASGAAAGGGGKPAVEAGQVQVMRLVDDTQAVGSLRSRQSVVLRPEVSGRITQLNFRDGDRVRKGQLLVQFDDQLPLAQVQQSMAELSIAQANHKRNQELVGQGFISQRSVDESSANLEVAQAKLALARATAQRLKLVAPFDGIAGIRTVNIGDYLKDGADVVNIEDIDAVYVDFRLPERFQTKVRRGQQASVELDALPGRKFVAYIQAVDPLIDANGRSVGVRGCIDNRQMQLRPGMFARVNAVFGERENALVIPEEAIVPQGNRQFVIKLVEGPDGVTTQRVEVKVGIRRPGRVEVLEGLKAGDRVVTAGQQRVQRDGTAVRVMELGAGGGAGGGPRGGAGAGGNGAGGGAGGAAAAGGNPAAGMAAGANPGSGGAPNAATNAATGAATGAATNAPAVSAATAAPAGGKPDAATAAGAKAQAGGPNPCLVGMADVARPAGPAAAPKRGQTPAPATDNGSRPGLPARNPA